MYLKTRRRVCKMLSVISGWCITGGFSFSLCFTYFSNFLQGSYHCETFLSGKQQDTL